MTKDKHLQYDHHSGWLRAKQLSRTELGGGQGHWIRGGEGSLAY